METPIPSTTELETSVVSVNLEEAIEDLPPGKGLLFFSTRLECRSFEAVVDSRMVAHVDLSLLLAAVRRRRK